MYTFVVTGAIHAFYKLKGTINKYRLLAFNIYIFFSYFANMFSVLFSENIEFTSSKYINRQTIIQILFNLKTKFKWEVIKHF